MVVMMIHTYSRRSKQKQKPKAVREQYEQWLESHKPKKVITAKSVPFTYSLATPPGRETVRHPSLNTTGGTATKSTPKVYTGDKMLGIATMHKSNSVPVFRKEDAVDISKMRR
jgi:hypothetical protein